MKAITCISCPVGCRMQVEIEDGVVTRVSGNACRRGDVYARQEAVNPMRMVTAVVRVAGSDMPLSVKTKEPIPKKDIFACIDQINALKLQAPIAFGQVLIEDVCGSGVAVIATKSLPA